jgi:hypothetical protein
MECCSSRRGSVTLSALHLLAFWTCPKTPSNWKIVAASLLHFVACQAHTPWHHEGSLFCWHWYSWGLAQTTACLCLQPQRHICKNKAIWKLLCSNSNTVVVPPVHLSRIRFSFILALLAVAQFLLLQAAALFDDWGKPTESSVVCGGSTLVLCWSCCLSFLVMMCANRYKSIKEKVHHLSCNDKTRLTKSAVKELLQKFQTLLLFALAQRPRWEKNIQMLQLMMLFLQSNVPGSASWILTVFIITCRRDFAFGNLIHRNIISHSKPTTNHCCFHCECGGHSSSETNIIFGFGFSSSVNKMMSSLTLTAEICCFNVNYSVGALVVGKTGWQQKPQKVSKRKSQFCLFVWVHVATLLHSQHIPYSLLLSLSTNFLVVCSWLVWCGGSNQCQQVSKATVCMG